MTEDRDQPRQAASKDDLEALLPLHVGGDLDAEQARACEQLLGERPEARARLDALRAARRAYMGSDRTAGQEPPDVWPAIRDALEVEGLLGEPRAVRSAPTATAWTRPRRVGALVTLVGAAAAAVLFVLAQGPGGPVAPGPGDGRGVASEGGSLERAGVGEKTLRQEAEALRELRDATPAWYTIEQPGIYGVAGEGSAPRLKRISLR